MLAERTGSPPSAALPAGADSSSRTTSSSPLTRAKRGRFSEFSREPSTTRPLSLGSPGCSRSRAFEKTRRRWPLGSRRPFAAAAQPCPGSPRSSTGSTVRPSPIRTGYLVVVAKTDPAAWVIYAMNAAERNLWLLSTRHHTFNRDYHGKPLRAAAPLPELGLTERRRDPHHLWL